MTYKGTALLGQSVATTAQMEAFVRRTNPDAPALADLYLQFAGRLGLRGDLAYAQAVLETNYFRYGSLVRPEQNNYAGLGAISLEQPGASFATPAEGVLAHLQHLYAYATKTPLPVEMALLDARYALVTRGSATCVGDLDGRWAVPGTDYGQSIDMLLNEILVTTTAEEPYSITQAYLATTSPNRPGPCSTTSGCWIGVQGIVIHRTASDTMDAWAIRNYFNTAPDGRHASSQFVLDNNVILQLMPIGEIAYHTAGKNQTHLGIETCEHNWGTDSWAETYRKLVWLTAYLVRTYKLPMSAVTGHFWWDKVNRPYDPTYMGWAPAEGKATGLFDWNQFITDVAKQAFPPSPIPVQVQQTIDCTTGLLLNSTTYVPIRPYTSCICPGASIQWSPPGSIVVQLPAGGCGAVGSAAGSVLSATTPAETGGAVASAAGRLSGLWQSVRRVFGGQSQG